MCTTVEEPPSGLFKADMLSSIKKSWLACLLLIEILLTRLFWKYLKS